MRRTDAIVVGSGPNGLAGALTLARAGLTVDVYELADSPGGGCRTEELNLPGFHNDVCSAVHPLLAASPFFKSIDLTANKVLLRTPRVAFAHPLDGGRAGAVTATVAETAAVLGRDRDRYVRLFSPFVRHADEITAALLSPMRSIPRAPISTAKFGLIGSLPAEMLARRFHSEGARALIAGVAAHSMLPLNAPISGGFGLFLMLLAHKVGWPVVEGGSNKIIDALVGELEALGGVITTDHEVKSLRELSAPTVLFDVSPDQLLSLCGDQLGSRFRKGFSRFRYGPGVCKVDWALSGPVPWQAEICNETATVHLGGTLEEVARSEADVARGAHPERPYCIVVQPGVVDPTRAPAGHQTLWSYCHVPSGSTMDMTDRIETQIDRFAPGFRDLVLARTTASAAEMERRNPNYIGGDINGGAATLRQTVLRPMSEWNPYRTGIKGVYLCSASTPPGGGVHGMCGLGAARTALADLGLPTPVANRENLSPDR